MGKKLNPVTLGLKLFLYQLIFVFASVAFMGTFAFALDSNVGAKTYSTVTALLFLTVYYKVVWSAAQKEGRRIKIHNKNNENKIKPNFLNPLFIGISASAVNIAALLMICIFGTSSYFNVAYRILQSTFIGWLGDDNLTYIPNCIIVTLIPIALTFPAYFTGLKQFSFTEKVVPWIVYKKPSSKNK